MRPITTPDTVSSRRRMALVASGVLGEALLSLKVSAAAPALRGR